MMTRIHPSYTLRSILRPGLALLLFFLALTAKAITVDEVPNVHVADRSRYVSNPSAVLSDAAVSSLDAEIGSLWTDTSVELAVVAVDRVDASMTPEEFATKLFEKWGIGKKDKDNGILVLLSRDDHAAIIRTGY
ncbi:MAG: TPM domain-containing protein, partial [Duncaniella sp.]|nr:TPM domain-containing protein [Duncaniella sp.]